MSKYRVIGDIGQWLSVFVMLGGIVLTITCDETIGAGVFSAACLLDVLATKIKYYGERYFANRSKKIKLKGRYYDLCACEDPVYVEPLA